MPRVLSGRRTLGTLAALVVASALVALPATTATAAPRQASAGHPARLSGSTTVKQVVSQYDPPSSGVPIGTTNYKTYRFVPKCKTGACSTTMTRIHNDGSSETYVLKPTKSGNYAGSKSYLGSCYPTDGSGFTPKGLHYTEHLTIHPTRVKNAQVATFTGRLHLSSTRPAGSNCIPGTETVKLSGSLKTTPVKHHNRAPIARADKASIDRHSNKVSIRVLSNDSDPDGDTLRVLRHTNPGKGSVVCTTRTCTYRTSHTLKKSTHFKYTISDGHGRTATAKVTVYPTDKLTKSTITTCATHPEAHPVTCYAPEVRLDHDEDSYPMGTDEFINHSSLRWAHDHGCKDDTVVTTGKINQHTLAIGGYTHRQNERTGLLQQHCTTAGATYNSAQLTRPSTSESDKPKDLATNEGFYLNLDNHYRSGDSPSGNQIKAPLTYSYGKGKYVTYWFMYGYNPGAVSVPGVGPDHHEGEWERITVLLDSTNHATGVLYSEHTCGAVRESWSAMTDGDSSNGSVTGGTHPIVYSSQGSHASYIAPLTHHKKLAICQGVQGLGDRARGNGKVWRTWQVKLTNAATEPWYGFGGAWGEVGTIRVPNPGKAINTGPLGPPWTAAVETKIIND